MFQKALFMVGRSRAVDKSRLWERKQDKQISTYTTGCYCRGSVELLNLLRWRYTSVPYL